MKICVLGAGVVGVSTAYALARLGHEVVVIDKGSDVASGASHANGAQLSYSFVEPFAGPGTLKKLPGYLLGTSPAIKLGLSLRPSYLRWALSFLKNCNSRAAKQNLAARLTLARQSQEAMNLFEQELGPRALSRTGHGKLILAQSEAENAAMQRSAAQGELSRYGQDYADVKTCQDIEPSLKNWMGDIKGAIYAPDDNALDPLTYCKALRRACETNFNSSFHFNETVQSLAAKPNGGFTVHTDNQPRDYDRIVICLGNDPNSLLKPLGLSVPIYPMQGYSVTVPVATGSPTTSITDLKNKIVFANIGSHMRIAGFLDANQRPKNFKARGEQLLQTARKQWPLAADYDGPTKHWTHFRPMTPSGVPIIGETKLPGLYINAGHGSLGYTFSAGSGMRIADDIGHALRNTNDDREKHYG